MSGLGVVESTRAGKGVGFHVEIPQAPHRPFSTASASAPQAWAKVSRR